MNQPMDKKHNKKEGLVLSRKAGQSIYIGRHLSKDDLEDTYTLRIVVDRIYTSNKKPAVVINVLGRRDGEVGGGQFMLIADHENPLLFGGVRVFFAGISQGVSEHDKCYACGSNTPHTKVWVNAKLRFMADPSVKIYRGERHVH